MKIVSNIFKYTHPDRLFIDKISFTYNPSKADRKLILAAMKNIEWLDSWAEKKKNYLKKDDEACAAYIYQTKHYRSVVNLLFPDDHFVNDNVLTLEVNPRVEKNGFLRIEYNPSKISLGALAACLNDIMPNGIDCIFHEGRVTRIDIAMDIKEVSPYQIILDYMHSRFRTSICESGKPDSIYIGKDNGENQLYMYDKAKELRVKNKIKPLSEYQFPAYGLTRIELRHRPEPAPKLVELYSLKNLLFKSMANYGTPPKIKGDNHFNVLRDLSVLKGIRYVLKQLTPKEHDEFVDKIKKYSKPDFIDLKKLWLTLPDALKQVYPYTNTFLTSISKS